MTFDFEGAISDLWNGVIAGLTGLQIMDWIVAYAGTIGLRLVLDHHRSEAGNSANGSGLWYTAAYPETVWIANLQALARRYRASRSWSESISTTSRTDRRPRATAAPTTGGWPPRGSATRCWPRTRTCG